MARFGTYAEVLTPEHVQWVVHARGLTCGRGPGQVLQDVVDRSGGRYQAVMPLSDSMREQGPADPARIIEGPFDPANPRRLLHPPADIHDHEGFSTDSGNAP